MFVHTISDGVVSTRQILLHDPSSENLESVWDNYVVAHMNRKTTDPDSMAHAEFMNMHGCQRVRRYMFYYDLSPESKAMFKDVMLRKNDKMSILIVLAPRTERLTRLYPDLTFPRLVNTVTGTIVMPDDVSSNNDEGAFDDGRFTRDIGYVFRIFDNDSATVEEKLSEVDEHGRTTALQLIQEYLKRHLAESRADASLLSRIHELTYHVQCGTGATKRYYLHYDSDLDEKTLDRILDDHSDLPVQSGFRITFVPRTAVTEALLRFPGDVLTYPVMIDAGRQEETAPSSHFGRRRKPLRF